MVTLEGKTSPYEFEEEKLQSKSAIKYFYKNFTQKMGLKLSDCIGMG
jgi:hypothetical protein